MDWESHRIVTRTGKSRALVFTMMRSLVVKEHLGLYASRDTTFYSMAKLESWIRKRGWRLENVSHFS